MQEKLHTGLPPILSLDNLANGAVYEMFGEALKKMAANISDPNTEATQVRGITVTMKAKPYKDRSGAELTVKVENKNAGLRPVETTMYIARAGGEILAYARNTKQEEIEFAQPDPPPPDGKSAAAN